MAAVFVIRAWHRFLRLARIRRRRVGYYYGLGEYFEEPGALRMVEELFGDFVFCGGLQLPVGVAVGDFSFTIRELSRPRSLGTVPALVMLRHSADGILEAAVMSRPPVHNWPWMTFAESGCRQLVERLAATADELCSLPVDTLRAATLVQARPSPSRARNPAASELPF